MGESSELSALMTEEGTIGGDKRDEDSTSESFATQKPVRQGSQKIANKFSLVTRKASIMFEHALHHMLPHLRQKNDQESASGTEARPRIRGGARLRGCFSDEDHRQTTREIVQMLRPLKGEEALRIAGFEYRTVSVRGDSQIIEVNNADEPELQDEKSILDYASQVEPKFSEEQDPTHRTTRLFHVESNEPIMKKNRKEFIADGDMYDEITRVCQEYAQEVMLVEGELEWVTICEAGNNKEPIRAIVSSSINADQDALDTTPTLLIATGKGKVRAGIFSRQHLLVSGMEYSTALPIVREARKRKMNIVMIDPNVHGDRCGMVTFEKSMAKVFQHWEVEDVRTDVPPLGKRDLFVLSHSQSGAQLARYLLDKSKHYVPHIRAVVFTDSTHNIEWARQDKELHQLLESDRSVYFKVSKKGRERSLLTPLDTLGTEVATDSTWHHRFGRISTRCAGTAEHSLTNWFARNHIWEHFDLQLQRSSPTMPKKKGLQQNEATETQS